MAAQRVLLALSGVAGAMHVSVAGRGAVREEMTMLRDDLVRVFEVSPAYDKRAESGGKYGQHCVDMLWLVKGELGVIQFRLFTGWYKGCVTPPGTVWREMRVVASGSKELSAPMPADIGYHSPKPMYEGQTEMDCHVLPGGKCFYDGSGLNAMNYFAVLVHEGGEKLWEALEREYAQRFEGARRGQCRVYMLQGVRILDTGLVRDAQGARKGQLVAEGRDGVWCYANYTGGRSRLRAEQWLMAKVEQEGEGENV